VRAVILAGGIGSRLRPFTVVVPKPLVPIGEIPIIELLIRQLGAQGFDRITLSVGHLSSLIEAFCGDGDRWNVQIDYLREDEALGTAGFLSLIEDLDDDRLLVVNGDILTDLDMGAVLVNHDPADGATICATQRSVQIEFGVIETDERNALSDYTEKPELSYDVSMGVNVISTWAIGRFVQHRRRLDMPDLMRAISAAGHTVRVVRTDSIWLDMGSMADLEAAVEAFNGDPGRFLP
jgi:NDP-sugar pyrophosphorylase family protein